MSLHPNAGTGCRSDAEGTFGGEVAAKWAECSQLFDEGQENELDFLGVIPSSDLCQNLH